MSLDGDLRKMPSIPFLGNHYRFYDIAIGKIIFLKTELLLAHDIDAIII